MQSEVNSGRVLSYFLKREIWLHEKATGKIMAIKENHFVKKLSDDRGDVPGWVLVVLMTTGLVTAIWTIAAPRLSAILKNSLDAMNGIR
jgi:hypothetical protein